MFYLVSLVQVFLNRKQPKQIYINYAALQNNKIRPMNAQPQPVCILCDNYFDKGIHKTIKHIVLDVM